MNKIKFILLILFFLGHVLCFAQDNPYKIINYSFISQGENKIIFYGNSEIVFEKICLKINKLILKGEGQLKILQIGDSHIQADYFSNRMRENIQTFAQGIIGSRGFIFPYYIAQTNNPENYRVYYSGKWENTKNIFPNNDELGFSGISITTYDTNSYFKIVLNNHKFLFHDFNKVKIYQSLKDSSFQLVVPEYISSEIEDKNCEYSTFYLNENTDSITFYFRITDSIQKKFTLYGIELENDDPGIIYSSVGVNGAETNSYTKCRLFEEQLKIHKPDWIILSLGTNDAYSKFFQSESFKNNLTLLINKIRNVLPDVFILITCPTDSYYRRKYPNKNIPIVVENIIKVATENNCAVWNLYEIMGGSSSIKKWLNSGLAASDKIHFTKAGYNIQGDLLFNAFLQAYDNIIDKGIKN